MDLMKLKAVLETENGREVMTEILKISGYGVYVLAGDQRQDAYNTGRASVGSDLVNMIKRIESGSRSEDGYYFLYLMQREELARQAAEKEENDGEQ